MEQQVEDHCYQSGVMCQDCRPGQAVGCIGELVLAGPSIHTEGFYTSPFDRWVANVVHKAQGLCGSPLVSV